MAKAHDADFDHGATRRVDTVLLIVHPTMTPEDISGVLGLEAHFARRVGDPRKTPKGTSLGGTYPDTRWRHCVRHELTQQWFADKIAAMIDTLKPHRAFLHHVRATGGTAEIVVQFLGDGYAGDSLSADVLAAMSDLRLDLGIECFIEPQA